MKVRQLVLPVLIVMFSVSICSQAWALATNELNQNIDFRFSNPGARAGGMGGAFIGLADDATAAFANPAGLTILTQPEVSIEFKYSDYTQNVIYEDGTDKDFNDSVTGTSFLSFVKPMGNATFALYRHEMLNMKQELTMPYDYYTVPYNLISNFKVNGVTYGAGLGLKLADFLSFGFSVGFAQLNYKYTVDFQNQANPADQGRYSEVDASDTAEQYTVALLLNPVGELNVGLVYRYGPEFYTTYEDFMSGGVLSVQNNIDIPDVYGVGVSYRLFGSLTAAVDVNRVKYSDLLKDYYYKDNVTLGLSPYQRWVKNTSEFDVDDQTEVHAGLEYAFAIGDTPLAVRCGYSRIPDHSIYFTKTGTGLIYETTRPEGDDDDIYSVGFGAVAADNIQIDVSASFGDVVDEGVVSLVYRFE